MRTPSILCEIHPNYMGVRKPRSKKPGCTCREVYDEVHRPYKVHIRTSADPFNSGRPSVESKELEVTSPTSEDVMRALNGGTLRGAYVGVGCVHKVFLRDDDDPSQMHYIFTLAANYTQVGSTTKVSGYRVLINHDADPYNTRPDPNRRFSLGF